MRPEHLFVMLKLILVIVKSRHGGASRLRTRVNLPVSKLRGSAKNGNPDQKMVGIRRERANFFPAPPSNARYSSDLLRSCSARLQAGTLESRRCPPEGGRYTSKNRVLPHSKGATHAV